MIFQCANLLPTFTPPLSQMKAFLEDHPSPNQGEIVGAMSWPFDWFEDFKRSYRLGVGGTLQAGGSL